MVAAQRWRCSRGLGWLRGRGGAHVCVCVCVCEARRGRAEEEKETNAHVRTRMNDRVRVFNELLSQMSDKTADE